MTDIELLTLAANAAGARYDDEMSCWMIQHSDRVWREWRPLTDDGDALRLAVKLGIEPCWHERAGYAVGRAVPPSGHVIRIEEFGDDPYAATRRAIVKAAAEIGRSK